MVLTSVGFTTRLLGKLGFCQILHMHVDKAFISCHVTCGNTLFSIRRMQWLTPRQHFASFVDKPMQVYSKAANINRFSTVNCVLAAKLRTLFARQRLMRRAQSKVHWRRELKNEPAFTHFGYLAANVTMNSNMWSFLLIINMRDSERGVSALFGGADFVGNCLRAFASSFGGFFKVFIRTHHLAR